MSAETTSAGKGHADPELEPGLAACSATGIILHFHHQTVLVLLKIQVILSSSSLIAILLHSLSNHHVFV